MKKYHPRVTHSTHYYYSILSTFIAGIKIGQTDQQIADALSVKGLLSPIGKQWTHTAVKAALFKLLHYKTMPNKLHWALLQLVFDGLISTDDALILFKARTPVTL